MTARDRGIQHSLSVLFVLTLLLLVPAAAFQSVPPPPDGLLGYWPGDDGTAPATALDVSGYGNNGTYSGGATTDPALVAPVAFTNLSSMNFNGTTANVSIPTFSWPSGGPVTVSFWNYVATADLQNSSAFSIGNQDQPNRFQAHAPWGDGNIYWDYGTATVGSGRVMTSYAGYMDNWTHVALVSAGSGGTNQAIYLNGTNVASVTTSSGPTVALSGATIGGWPLGGFYIKGHIDDFRVFNRVLTDPEISALAAGQLGPSAPFGLTANSGTSQVSLSWTASAGPGSVTYSVGRATVSGGSPPGNYQIIQTGITGLNYTDTPPTAGQQYFYVVFADSFGPSLPSNQVAALTGSLGSASGQLGGKGDATCHASASGPMSVAPFALGLTILVILLVRRR